MIENHQSVLWDQIVSGQNNPYSVERLKQSLRRKSKRFGIYRLDTDHIESLPGGVEGVRDSPIERATEGENEKTWSVEEIESQEYGAIPQESVGTAN